MSGARRGAALALVALMLSLSACSSAPKKEEETLFAMDTVMSLTLYGDNARDALAQATDTLEQLDELWSPTQEDSQIWAVNHSGGSWTTVDGETSVLLQQSLELCQITDGALDITAYPAVEAWGFPSGDYRVPAQAELDQLASRIDYSQVELAGNRVRLPASMSLDLGAVAKGWAGELLSQQLSEAGIKSALLDLGQSTIQTVGTKPDGSPWRIGIQDPAGESYLGILELTGQAMGTSGDYQRYFEQDGVRYCHIIDTATAAPARSGVRSVTVVSSSALNCDALSTALFVMGTEKGVAFWREHPELDFQALWIGEDGTITLTKGLQSSFSLAQGYEDREVQVVS